MTEPCGAGPVAARGGVCGVGLVRQGETAGSVGLTDRGWRDWEDWDRTPCWETHTPLRWEGRLPLYPIFTAPITAVQRETFGEENY